MGKLRYFIGCQIDVTNLIEGGRSLESFQMLLDEDVENRRQGGNAPKGSHKALGDMGELLSTEEMEVLKFKTRNPATSSASTPAPAPQASLNSATARRYVGIEDPLAINVWPPTQFGPHGRLPGVYQNFMLVRPWPSLRILFTSAALRIPGLAQSRLLDRIGGPHSVREGIAAAFAEGARVTAKVYWLTGNVNGSTNNHSNRSSARISGPAGAPQQFHTRSNSIEGKPRYIHCTPLHGADGAPGVWMVVMVEKEDITGTINSNNNGQNGRARRSSFGILNGTYAQEKLFEQQQQVQQQYRLLRQSASGGGGECIIDGGAGAGTGYSSRRRTRTSSTFFDDDERSIPASSSAYAEYLASGGGGGGLRSGSVSRGPSRPPSRAASMPGWAASRPEQPTRKMTPREETARMVRLPMQTERLGEVDES
ncbi:PAS domain-containing protein [Lasiodiplodia theobromae]|nr:PAS domain-containing protein [Lasiodiplodia theobromae]